MQAASDEDGKPVARDLTRGPIGKTLLVFALPILAGNVLQSLNGSVNAIWVGRYLGEAALAATANANNIMFFLLGAVFGVGMAATVLVGQAMGRRDVQGAKRVIGTSTTFFLGISVLVAIAGWPLSRHILDWMGTPADALPLAEAYLRIIFLAVPSLYLFASVTALLRGAGDTRTPFWFLLLVLLLDVVINPLLIFCIGPFPRMGVAGSAMAIGAACSSMAAQNVGAGNWARVDGTARTGTLFNVLLTGALIAPIVLLDRYTLGLFLPEGSTVLDNARQLNHIAVWSFLFFGVNFVISGVVRATGAVVPPLLILALALWGIRIPFASLMQPVLGIDAIWWSFPVSALSAMLMSMAYYRWRRWRQAKMMAGQPAADTDEIALPAELIAAPNNPVADCCPRTMPHRHLEDGRVVPA